MTSFTWRLPDLLLQHELAETSKLRPLLAAHGVELSREQVFRLVKQPPERLSLKTLVALCAIFNCTASELIEVSAVAAAPAAPRRANKKAAVMSVKRVKLR
jgi:DNA-binding Xre family transcriptional regulator